MSETTTDTIDHQETAPQADGRSIIAMLGEAEAGGCCGGGSCAL